MSSPIDPIVLLNVLEPILDSRTGGIREIHLADRFVNVMRDARKLVQRCTYLNIFNATLSEEIRKEILKLGAWDILFEWLRDAERFSHWSVVGTILQLFIDLPVSIDHIRSNGVPKLVRRLSKRQDIESEIKNLATDILSIWKDIVIDDHVSVKEAAKQEPLSSFALGTKSTTNGMASNIDPNIDVEADEANPPSSVSSSSSSGSYYGYRWREGKSAENTNTHLKISKPQVPAGTGQHQKSQLQQQLVKLGKSDVADKLNRKDSDHTKHQKMAGKDDKVDDSSKKMSNDLDKRMNAIGAKRTHGLSSTDTFGAALTGGDGTDVAKKRPKTVKTYRAASRSTGLDQEPDSSTHTSKKRKAIPDTVASLKRRDSTENSKQSKQEKGPSPGTDKTKSSPGTVATAPRTSSTDSSLLIDQLPELPFTSSVGVGSGLSATKLPKPAAPVKAAQMIESDSFMAALTGSSQQRPSAVIRRKKISSDVSTNSASKTGQSTSETSVTKPQFYKEIIRTPTSDASTLSQQNALAASSGTVPEDSAVAKPEKRRVRWAKDSELVRIQYFELEEGERAHKALGANLASLDKKMEREALEAARKGLQRRDFAGGSEPETYFTWKLAPCDNIVELVPKGSKSEEKKVQHERMRNILAEIYFTYDMIPDTPKEPDIVVGASSQSEASPIIIPLTEVTFPGDTAQPVTTIAGTNLPPELAQLMQNLNKSGILPQVPQTTTAGMTGFVGTPAQQVGLGFGIGVAPSLGQFPGSQQVPFGVSMPIDQTIGSFPGMIPQMSNTGQQVSAYGNQVSSNLQEPPFGFGQLAVGGWNSQMANALPPTGFNRQPQNGGGFRPRGPPAGGGFGSRNRFQSPQFRQQGPFSQRSDRLCPFFLRGRCTFGDNCKYTHEKPASLANHNSPPADSPSSPPTSPSSPSSSPRSSSYHRHRHRRHI